LVKFRETFWPLAVVDGLKITRDFGVACGSHRDFALTAFGASGAPSRFSIECAAGRYGPGSGRSET